MLDGIENDCTRIKVNINDKNNKKERFTEAINTFTPDMVEKYKSGRK